MLAGNGVVGDAMSNGSVAVVTAAAVSSSTAGQQYNN
jgi:hypothetical protein